MFVNGIINNILKVQENLRIYIFAIKDSIFYYEWSFSGHAYDHPKKLRNKCIKKNSN